jgi:ABC-type uncharacterized transport system fused permease/ATPase subunit
LSDEKGLLQTIDNPDQRIVTDVASFTKAVLNFSVVFLGAFLRVFSFATFLYHISASQPNSAFIER